MSCARPGLYLAASRCGQVYEQEKHLHDQTRPHIYGNTVGADCGLLARMEDVVRTRVCADKCHLFGNCKSYSLPAEFENSIQRFAVISMNTPATNGSARRIL